jgi:MSHA biogenesis protein MshN
VAVAKMSLINQMLQDLEQRRSQSGERGLPAGVRAVAPRNSERRSGWWLATLVVLLGIIAVLVWLLQRRPPAVPVNPLVVVQAPVAPVAAPAPAPTPASMKLVEIPAVPKPVAAKKVELPPANLAKALDRLPDATLPVSVSEEKVKAVEEARAVTSKNDSAGKKAEPVGVAQVKQISPLQQAEFSYQKAVALLQQGRVAEAQESLGESLRAAPDHAASRQTLAGVLVEKKQYAQAEQLLREGLVREGSQPEFAMAMARIQVERGDGRGALETLQQHLPGAKDHAAYQAFLAAMLQRQGQHKPAIEHYLTALRLAPSSASSLVGLGISLQAENHPAEAQEAFSRARTSGGLSPELQNFVEQRLKQLQQQPR